MQCILKGPGIREESFLFLCFRNFQNESMAFFKLICDERNEKEKKKYKKGKKKIPGETLNSSWLGGFRHNWSALVPGGYLQWKFRFLQLSTRVLVIVGALWLDRRQYQEESGRVIKRGFFITEQFFWRMTSLGLKRWIIG